MCGIFGIYGCAEASILTALGLHALQHRGQEACGIASHDTDTGRFHTERHLGLVGDNFGGERGAGRLLPGHAAIGHNRYSTSGQVVQRNIQPLFADLSCGGFAIAHNGNLANARALRKQLVDHGAIFQSTTDTEVILQLLARSGKPRLIDRFIDALRPVVGGYALVGLSAKKLIGARDPWGLRPLVLGDLDGSPVLASETCALDAVGANYVRDIENGEIVVFSGNGMETHRPFPARPSTPCVFEYLYFARFDSVLHGRGVYEIRRALGRNLATEHPVDGADIVCPAPDGGNPAAIGYAERSGIPFQFGIVRNHYVGRTFIQPTEAGRQSAVAKKHAANRSQLRGRSVALIDDSVVRGNTARRIVAMVRDAGAREVHLRVASPPIRYPDHYGIDMPSPDELLAARMDVDALREWIGVDSLGFLSLAGFYDALGEGPPSESAPRFADHCFTGRYPTMLEDRDHFEAAKDVQLSLLDD